MATLNQTEQKLYTFALVGRKGDGKSATGNTILGQSLFSASLASTTPLTPCIEKSSASDLSHVSVIDTPGFFNTEVEDAQVEKELTRIFELAPDGIDAFLLVLRSGRFTPELNNTVRYFKELFGPDVMKYTVVVFSGLDDLEFDGETFESYLEQMPEETLTMLPERKVAFNNRSATNEENEYQVARLLEHVEQMGNKDRYTRKILPIKSPLQNNGTPIQRVPVKEDITPPEQSYNKLQTDISKEELRVAVVGRNADGKNAFVTEIVSHFTEATTETVDDCVKHTGQVRERNIVLLDTGSLQKESLMAQATLQLIPPGPNVVIVVLKVRPSNVEMVDVLKTFKMLFGKDVNNFTFVVFTNPKQAKMYGNDLQEYTENLSDDVRNLIKHSIDQGMVIAFNEDESFDQKLQEMIMKIDLSVKRNGDCFRRVMQPSTSIWKRCVIS